MNFLLLWSLITAANFISTTHQSGCDHEMWFVCSDGSGCNHREQFCDGEHSFCSDGSDEILYNETIHSADDGIPCRGWNDLNRICLLPSELADKNETICNNEQRCQFGGFRCSDLSKCISLEDYCNGVVDCEDGSDEITYDPAVHTSEDGIPCYLDEWQLPRCLLPAGHEYICDAGAEVECSDDEFRCDYNTKCIEASKYCDGEPDCEDGTDEIPFEEDVGDLGVACQNKKKERFCLLPPEFDASEICFNVQKDCRPEWFVCASGTACFHREGFCDGHARCSDGSDEVLYASRVHRKKRDGIACRGWHDLNKFCLLHLEIVDREQYICNKEKECDFFKPYRCADNSTCIDKERYCDGHPDCSDGSDEITYDLTVHGFQDGVACFMGEYALPSCFLPPGSVANPRQFCDKVECTKDQFKCLDGSACVSMNRFCDGKTDCFDGSDEIISDIAIHGEPDGIQCHPRYTGRTCLLPRAYGLVSRCFNVDECRDDWFICSDKKNCMYKESFCDGEHTMCEDGSDEVLYNASIHTEKDGVPCRGWTDLSRVCLLPAAIADREDSICNKEQTCLFGFRCSDKSKCISKEDYCDGYEDCSDGSDEIVYDSKFHTEKDGISCYLGEWDRKPCLLPPGNNFLCDHVQCGPGEYNCANAVECIPGRKFCDFNPDCSDGSDEVIYDSSRHDEYVVKCRSHVKVDHVCAFEQWVFEDLCYKDCTNDSFMCEDKSKCIPKEKFCDTVRDCPDGSDEVRYRGYIGTDAIQCTSWSDVGRHCVLPVSHSDKKELVCNIAQECPDGTYKCANGRQCIQGDSFCDGVEDCRDGSDEIAYNSFQHTLAEGVSCKGKDGRKCLVPSKFKTNLIRDLPCGIQ